MHNLPKISYLIDNFISLAKKPSLSQILSMIDKNETFADRIKCAEKYLSHLSSGSSRIVFKSPSGSVIKLAKNEKGIAQNKEEVNISKHCKSKYINPIISHSKNFFFIETHLLPKINEKDFEQMTGVPFNDFGNAMRFTMKNLSHNNKKEPENFSKISASDIYKNIIAIAKKFSLMGGDLARISSFGKKDNHPVLLDTGLTKNVFEKFYDSSSSSDSLPSNKTPGETSNKS
jgi:hypothetical protein